MNTTTPPIVSVPKSQLKDDVVEKLTGEGYTLKEVESLLNQLAYRKEYNSRPEVQAKRKLYNQKRNLKMKIMKNLLSQM